MQSVSDVAVERISLSIFQALYEELERLSNLISTAKLQHRNSDVNTLKTSILANEKGGSFAKIGTIDCLCWAKIKMFLPASRKHSTCKQKTFYLQVETLLFAGRKYETWKNQEKRH
jgi:ribosomal protein S1